MDIGRYTPTANGSADTPDISSISASATPSSTRSQGSFRVRMPSMISENSRAFGASNRVSFTPCTSATRPPMPGSTTYSMFPDASLRYFPVGMDASFRT